jgi:hypothetical protein
MIGTVSLSDTNVTPGAYTLTNLTVDAQGRITEAASGQALTTVDEISETPDDKGALISGPNDSALQLCAADATHRGVLFGYTKANGGDTNTTLGYQAGPNVSSYPEGNNTVVGQGALQTYAANIGWKDNTAVGKDALKNVTNIGDATAIGAEAGASLQDDEGGTAGEGYIAIGRRAGGGTLTDHPKVAYDCIYIGNDTASDSAQADSQIVLGHGTTGTNHEMTVANYIEKVKWSGLTLHQLGDSSSHYFLTCDGNQVMKRFQVPAWRVRMNSTSYTVPNGSGAVIVFDTIVFEKPTTGLYSTSTGAFTCPFNGIYWVEATVRFASANASLTIWIAKNDSSVPAGPQHYKQGVNTNPSNLHISGLWSCSAGDTLKVYAVHSLGSPLGILGSHLCTFSGYWVGPN